MKPTDEDRDESRVEAAMRVLNALTDVDLAEVLDRGLQLKEMRDEHLNSMGISPPTMRHKIAEQSNISEELWEEYKRLIEEDISKPLTPEELQAIQQAMKDLDGDDA